MCEKRICEKRICEYCGREYEIREGNREHWFFWDTQGTHCNYEKEKKIDKNG